MYFIINKQTYFFDFLNPFFFFFFLYSVSLWIFHNYDFNFTSCHSRVNGLRSNKDMLLLWLLFSRDIDKKLHTHFTVKLVHKNIKLIQNSKWRINRLPEWSKETNGWIGSLTTRETFSIFSHTNDFIWVASWVDLLEQMIKYIISMNTIFKIMTLKN